MNSASVLEQMPLESERGRIRDNGPNQPLLDLKGTEVIAVCHIQAYSHHPWYNDVGYYLIPQNAALRSLKSQIQLYQLNNILITSCDPLRYSSWHVILEPFSNKIMLGSIWLLSWYFYSFLVSKTTKPFANGTCMRNWYTARFGLFVADLKQQWKNTWQNEFKNVIFYLIIDKSYELEFLIISLPVYGLYEH